MPAAVPSAALFAGAAELVSCFWMGQAAMVSTATGKQVLCGGCLPTTVAAGPQNCR